MDNLYDLWLSNVLGAGNAKVWSLLKEYENAKNIFMMVQKDHSSIPQFTSAERKAAREISLTELEAQSRKLMAEGVRIISVFDEEYPDKLSNIYNPPYILYACGDLSIVNDRLSVCVIGSRKMTPYGESAAKTLSGDLSKAGAVIVSGMAYGIDSVSHREALANDAGTVAVMATGIDVTYPKVNTRLRAEIEKTGAVITEYHPGMLPLKQNFPVRNRIMSGLCDCVLVVEAAERSGTSITVGHAVDQNRDVYVVPNSIFSVGSAGSNKMLKSIARPATSAADILIDYIDRYHDLSSESDEVQELEYTKKQIKVISVLSPDPIHVDEILLKLPEFTSGDLAAVLIELEIYGEILSHPGRRYSLK